MARPRRVPVAVAALALAALMAVSVPGAVSWTPAAIPLPLRGPPLAPVVADPSPVSGARIELAPGASLGVGISDLGPLSADSSLTVAVGLTPTDAAGLLAAEALSYTPGTPQFHRFLSAPAVTAKFGPAPGEYQRALAYFRSFGATVTPSPDRLLLTATGSPAELGRAFGTTFDEYSGPQGRFYSHTGPATLPAIAGWSGALGLGDQTAIHPTSYRASTARPVTPQSSCGSGGFGLAPCQVATAYDENGLLGGGTNGSGVRVGVVDAYDSAENQTALASDFATFASTYSLPSGKVQFVYPVPTDHNLNTSKSDQWGVEEALDLEWARAAAPGDSVAMTLAPDASAGLYAAVDWLVAHHSVDVLSLSWGEPDVGVYNPNTMPCSNGCNASSDGSYTLLHPVLEEAALEGISVFSASGDCGSADGTVGVSTGYPASDASVTGVGGTYLTLNGSDGWVGEVAWSGNASGNSSSGCANQGGSGGGFAPVVRPWWQAAPGVPTSPDDRGVPDVAMIGGTPVSVVLGGGVSAVGGTSESTPIWAGIAAIADQYHGGALGLLNPSLYSIARGGQYHSAFHDILSGTNGYRAGAGWDPVTGLGTPVVGVLVPLLANPGLSDPTIYATVHASPRFGPVGVTTTVVAGAGGGTGSFPMFDIDFGDGNATLTSSGVAVHTYPNPGVYTVRATAFDSSGNTSTAPPVAVVVGGGSGLGVTLTPSTTSPTVGLVVTFNATVVGGLAPFRYNYSFGDGTYLENTSLSSVTHVYPQVGGYCAAVEVRDLLAAPDGGASPRVTMQVGGAPAPPCEAAVAVGVTLTSSVLRADLPGDFPFRPLTSGGVGPVETQLSSDDPYVAACNCGIFRTTGFHTVTVTASDALVDEATATLNVTTDPAISAQFNASALSGTAPLSEVFQVTASGGQAVDASTTSWSFGDGATGRGANVGHVYTTPGLYVAVGNLSDPGFGNASEAFLIDVLPSGAGGIVLTANVTPAVHTASGAPMAFHAFASGGSAPYRFHWGLGDGDSAFGASVNQTYSPHGCLENRTCPLTVYLNVTDSVGQAAAAVIALDPLFSATWSALTLFPNVTAGGGVTPYPFRGVGTTGGIVPSSVTWTFGDGTVITGANVRHTFLSPGNFTTTVVATDGVGDELVRTYAYVITGTVQTGPQATGGPNVTGGLAPLSVGFRVAGGGGSGPPFSFNWSFGDGTVGSGANVTHRYVRPGVFQSQVTVSDAIGTTGTETYAIDAYNATSVIATATPSFPSSSRLGLALHVVAACEPTSILACSNSLVQLRLTWSYDGGGSFGVDPDAGVVGFPASGYANVSIPLPDLGGTYHLALTAVGPAFVGGTNLTLGINGRTTGLGGISLAPTVILGVGAAFAFGMAGMLVVVGRMRPPAPGRSKRSGPTP